MLNNNYNLLFIYNSNYKRNKMTEQQEEQIQILLNERKRIFKTKIRYPRGQGVYSCSKKKQAYHMAIVKAFHKIDSMIIDIKNRYEPEAMEVRGIEKEFFCTKYL